MSKIKVNNNKNFTVIQNDILQNKQISLKAKGLFCYMWSLPDDWDYSINGLYSLCKDGRDSIRSAIKELEDNGYLIREKKRNCGKFSGNDYQLNEKPFTDLPYTEKPLTENPITVNPITEKPLTENPRQQSTKELSTKKESTNELNNKNKNKYVGSDEPCVSDKIKKISKAKEIEQMINDFTEDYDLRNRLFDFVEMRKDIRKPMTVKAIELMLAKLNNITFIVSDQIKILENSIENSWSGVFPLKEKKEFTNKTNTTESPFLKYMDKINRGTGS